MELVLVVTAAGLIGAALRYIVPGRDRHGLALMPAAGVIIGSLTWTLGIWVGLEPGSVWPWILSLGLALAGTAAIGVQLPKRRDEADRERWETLTSPS